MDKGSGVLSTGEYVQLQRSTDRRMEIVKEEGSNASRESPNWTDLTQEPNE